MATRTKKARRQRHTTPDSAERLLALAKEWSSPIPWEIVAKRLAKWQSEQDYTNSLRRIAWKARDGGEAEDNSLYQQIVNAEHQEEVWEKHLRAMSAQIVELESLIERLRPDLKGDYGPASQCPEIYTPRERAERVCNVLAKLTTSKQITADLECPLERPATTENPSADLPAIDQNDTAILRALKESAPQTCTLYEIEAATKITRKTAGEHIDYLIGKRLACRPKGKRRGATITTAGISLLEELPAPK